MNDAMVILDEVATILAMNGLNHNEQLAILWEYVEQKRVEYAPITNAKWECSV